MTRDEVGLLLTETESYEADAFDQAAVQHGKADDSRAFADTAAVGGLGSGAGNAYSPVKTLKHYEFIRRLGAGGMGAVYLARDTVLGRLVAIKLLIALSGPSAARFLVEARATARCKHENIVTIHEVGEHDGYPYMVLEHIDGQSLQDWMVERSVGGAEISAKNTSVPASLAIELMLPVTRALLCAHKAGIVHRDLKPSNIMMDASGPVKVLDFGIAKMRDVLPEQRAKEDAQGFTPDLSLTPNGAMMGTLAYMSPEQWGQAEVDERSDIWAVGMMLFELVTGEHPLAPLTYMNCAMVGVLDVPMRSVLSVRPDLGALGAVIDRCLKKEKSERIGSAEELYSALVGLLPGQKAFELGDGESPFAGLSAFQEADATRFFGRERDVALVVTQLRHNALVSIAGASGAGKSSFVRAGLIPALKRSGQGWEALLTRPGQHPLAALAELCSRVAPEVGQREAHLREVPGYLGSMLRAYCREKSTRLLVFVDQFEEVYTLCTDEAERTAVVANLIGAADDVSSPVRVVLSIRSDFLDRVTVDRRMMALLTRGLYFLPTMGHEDLEAALVKPVEALGCRWESAELVEGMLEDLKKSTSPLPLLQFTVTKLWEKRDRERRVLTQESYEMLGGVAGALATHADSTIHHLSTRDQKLAREIFLQLVTEERTRAVVNLSDLYELDGGAEAVQQVVEHLSAARLVQIESVEDRACATVELVHESLMISWPKLRGWLEESQEETAVLSRVRPAAKQWQAGGESKGLLWSGEAAEDLERWQKRQGSAATAKMGERDARFVAAVVALVARERTRRRRIATTLIGALLVVVVLVSALAVRAKRAAVVAEEQKERAEQQTLRADAEKVLAEQSAAQARNATRMAAARERLEDPTTVVAILREIEPGALPRGWAGLSFWARWAGIASDVFFHEDAVFSAAISPDGKRIVSASKDKTVRVWNADGSGEPLVLRAHTDIVSCVAFSPDGKLIVSASGDKTVRVWNADGKGEPLVLKGHEDGVSAASFSSDGKRVVSGSLDRTVRVWNADGSGEPVILKGHDGLVSAAAFSPDMNHIVSASADQTIRVWNANGSGKPVVLKGHDGLVSDASFSPDGKRIVSASWDKTVRVWNAEGSGEPMVLKGHEGDVSSATFSPDGDRIVSGSYDKAVRVWNADGSGQALVLKGHDDRIYGVAWGADGRHLVSVSGDKTVRMWGLSHSGQPLVLKGHEGYVSSATFSPDGKRIVSTSLDKTLRVWNAEGAMQLALLQGHEALVYGAAWSPDSKRIVSASWDKTVRVWNADGTGQPTVLRGHDSNVYMVAFSPDGKRIVSTSQDKTVRVWNADGSGEALVLRGHNDFVFTAAFSSDSKHIVTASGDKTVRVWNADGSGEPVVLKGHDGLVYSAAFSPDGLRIASASGDSTVRVWNADGSGEPLILRGHDGFVFAAVFTPDGKHIVSASGDKTMRVWNVDGSGTPVVLKGHEDAATLAGNMPFSPDGKRVVSSSDDGTVRVWNIDGTGEALVLRASNEAVNTASFSPDGQRIVAASDDKTVHVWNDLTPFQTADDPRLWAPTAYCMPLDVRQRVLGFPEPQSRADLARCQQRVRER